jgi:hypothetical protein
VFRAVPLQINSSIRPPEHIGYNALRYHTLVGQAGVKDFLTIGCAVLGATLGIINTVMGLSQRRVRLRVTPKMSIQGQTGTFSNRMDVIPGGGLSIDVVNSAPFRLRLRRRVLHSMAPKAE